MSHLQRAVAVVVMTVGGVSGGGGVMSSHQGTR